MSEEKITYRMANGDLIYGEYGWVGDLEFFDDIDEPVTVVKETWNLLSSEELELKPSWWSDEEEDSDD